MPVGRSTPANKRCLVSVRRADHSDLYASVTIRRGHTEGVPRTLLGIGQPLRTLVIAKPHVFSPMQEIRVGEHREAGIPAEHGRDANEVDRPVTLVAGLVKANCASLAIDDRARHLDAALAQSYMTNRPRLRIRNSAGFLPVGLSVLRGFGIQ